MTILAIDDEQNNLEYLVFKLHQVVPDAEVVAFSDPYQLLDYVAVNSFDVLFLDITMPQMDGITLGKKVKELRKRSNLIFVTGYENFMGQAFRLDASDYIVKPITEEQISHALENLRYDADIRMLQKDAGEKQKGIVQQNKLYFQCFGNFEVFYNDKPVEFDFGKTKELLAYLVDRRGALATNNEIISQLWEDDGDHLSYFKAIRRDLLTALKKLGAEHILERQWGSMAIKPNEISCDYYDYHAGKPEAIRAYIGEYMNQYSWAEYTNGALSKRM